MSPDREGVEGIDPRGGRTLWWYGTVLVRHRRMILGVAIIAAVIVGLASFLRTRQYAATMVLRPMQSTAAPAGLNAITAQLGIGALTNNTNSPEFYSQFVTSRELMRDLAMREFVVQDPPFRGTLVKYLEIEPSGGETVALAAVKELRKRIKTSIDALTGTVNVEIRLPHPVLAEQAAIALLDLVVAHDLKLRQGEATAERAFIQQQVGEELDRLRAAEDSLTRFYEQNRQFFGAGAASPMLRAEESRLQRRVSQREQFYVTLSQTYARAQVEESRNTPSVTVLERPEGFVRPHPRGTIRNGVLALIVGAMLAIFIALIREYAADSRASGIPEYAEFQQTVRGAKERLRIHSTRRNASPQA